MKKVILIFLLVFALFSEADSQWIKNVVPYSLKSIGEVKFFNDNTGYAKNYFDPSLVKTTNGGLNWITYSTTERSLKFSIINDSTIIDLIDPLGPNQLVKTTNSGLNWLTISVFNSINPLDMSFVNEMTGWIAANGTIWRTTNGGQNFEQQIFGITGPGFQNLLFFDSLINGKYYGVAYTSEVYTTAIRFTTNSGESWSEDITWNTGSLGKLKFYDRKTLFACYSSTILLKINNFESNWTVYNVGAPANGQFNMMDFKVVNPEGVIYCVGSAYNYLENIIWKTTNGGLNWGYQPINVAAWGSTGIDMLNADTGWIMNADNTFYKTTNGGGNQIIPTSGIQQVSSAIPNNYSLSQNYPNPFNPSTKINYEIRSSGFVSLKVFDLLGKEVATLINEKQSAGSYVVDFNSSEFNLPSGIYFYTLSAGEFKETRKMLLIK